ncbi:MAG: VacB/RNase II family 3'-5' exoribonuclease, partial [Pirellulaceae bacterium]|nr:VacB/RNase II family 3'-5' exoribonuclease [Pirellulaceae bacterium]
MRKAVKRLVREGRLAYGINHLVAPAESTAAGTSKKTSRKFSPPRHVGQERDKQADVQSAAKRLRRPKPSANRLLGVFQRTEKGFGFVRLRGGDPNVELKDVYVPADKSGDAATGDVVLVEIDRKRRGGPGPRGEIVEIVERQTNRFVGTYFETADAAYARIDGVLFARPIYVGDPGAKNVRPDDKVVIEMLRFPSPPRDGEGVVVEVLGPRGRPGVDTLSIIREFGLPDKFAEDALEEARRLAKRFDEAIGDRTDFTGETVVTIDPADARDFDDAISLERLESGNWRLGVHIADVSHFVRPRTALDREASDRATSVYLPDRVLPMLPEVISNGLASLQPGKVRYTKTAIMEFTAEGLRVSTELHSAAIKSSKRLTYEQVDAFLQEPEFSRRKLGAKVCGLLGRMNELAMILRRRRFANGALELNMPEIKVDLDKNGKVTGAHVLENTVSHQIIEEFMLAANEAVAEELQQRGFHFLRRIHQSPSPRKLKALTEFVAELGYETASLESRFELQKLLDESAERPERHAVHFAVLRSMQRAVYSPEQEGHYALASRCYCHFTSPIRRYPDLTIHRLVDAALKGVKPADDFDALTVLGHHCSDREKRAETAERDLTKLKLIAYLGERIGEEMEAVVTGVESYGIFVQGVELPAEGLVRVETLRDDHYY